MEQASIDLGTFEGSGENDDGTVEGLDFSYEDINWKSEYKSRIERLKHLCSKEYKPQPSIIDLWKNGTNPDVRFVVDERHQILYCELPKVGCTNWKRTMLQFRVLQLTIQTYLMN